ncbi:hypothetical protein Tdes44962_MAKER09825 [Teratosphaeria destructans]|uniref:Uncharacterized protein n=1 Tax=Teratosphaeria destructans TaxID=418781 RepID=A0A9W7SQZ5_9PEZI|nr:hypothetical protein Tdes44962_MAKER09825 [Teratosphaeria destructans]
MQLLTQGRDVPGSGWNGAYFPSNFNRLLVPRTLLPASHPASGDGVSQSPDDVAIPRRSHGVKARNSRPSCTNVDSALEDSAGIQSLHTPPFPTQINAIASLARSLYNKKALYHHVTDTLVPKAAIWNASQAETV